jgi:hypothetical protein
MVPVASSNLAAVGYDPATGELRIRFHRGNRLYAYYGISAALHRGLMTAGSKGRFFAYYIRWRYRGHRLT